MFHLSNTLTKISLKQESLCLQIVRYKRKPAWIPMAKSKMYKVAERPQIPADEAEELKRISNNYRSQMKSIKRFLVMKYNKQERLDDSEHKDKAASEDFERCNKINEEWNAKVRVEREKFFEEVIVKDVEIAKKRLEFQQFKKALELEEAENIIKQQKEESKGFITSENIDEAIEKALGTVVDHNFSIDLQGNKFYGRETVPEIEDKEKKTAVQQ